MLRLISFGSVLLFAMSVEAQLARPGALDSYNKCAGLTCLWTMDSKTHIHSGPYEAYLDVPDQDKNDGYLVVRSGNGEVARVKLEELSASVTLTWARDHRAFAVSWSDGGAEGDYHTKVFSLDGDAFVEAPTVSRAFRHFAARHNCTTRGDNVQAYRFDGASKSLMLDLSVYPTGDCGIELGHTEGYLVRIADGAILRCLTVRQLHAYMRRYPESK